MAASTIAPLFLTNDSGTFAAPALDGTNLNNAWFQTLIAAINAMFAGGGGYNPFTFGALIAAEGFGIHTFSAGGTGNNAIAIRNTSAGTSNFANLLVGNDGSASAAVLYHFSSTYTTAGRLVQDSCLLDGSRVGGLGLAASHASGVIRFYTGGGTQTGLLTATGEWRVGNGSVSTPAFSFLADTDSGFWWDNSSAYIGAGINGVEIFRILGGVGGGIAMRVADYGAGNIPTGVVLQQNSNVSNPVAGWVQFVSQAALGYYVWADNAGDLRIGTLANIQADNGGTVIGTQTSQRAAKDLLGPYTEDAAALALIRSTPLHRFRYKSGALNRQEFVGIVAEESPAFAMDAGRVFNPISASGYLMSAVKELARRLDHLEAAA